MRMSSRRGMSAGSDRPAPAPALGSPPPEEMLLFQRDRPARKGKGEVELGRRRIARPPARDRRLIASAFQPRGSKSTLAIAEPITPGTLARRRRRTPPDPSTQRVGARASLRSRSASSWAEHPEDRRTTIPPRNCPSTPAMFRRCATRIDPKAATAVRRTFRRRVIVPGSAAIQHCRAPGHENDQQPSAGDEQERVGGAKVAAGSSQQNDAPPRPATQRQG